MTLSTSQHLLNIHILSHKWDEGKSWFLPRRRRCVKLLWGQQQFYLLFAKREQKRGNARPRLSSTNELIERDEEGALRLLQVGIGGRICRQAAHDLGNSVDEVRQGLEIPCRVQVFDKQLHAGTIQFREVLICLGVKR